MKAVDLAKIAASAEGLRLRRQALRLGKQTALLVLAGIFGLFSLISLHVVLWTICDGPWGFGKVGASLAVLAFDLVIAGLLAFLGRSRRPSMIEIEARITRDRTLAEMRHALAFTAVLSAVTGPAGRMAARSVLGMFSKGRSTRR